MDIAVDSLLPSVSETVPLIGLRQNPRISLVCLFSLDLLPNYVSDVLFDLVQILQAIQVFGQTCALHVQENVVVIWTNFAHLTRHILLLQAEFSLRLVRHHIPIACFCRSSACRIEFQLCSRISFIYQVFTVD